MTGANREYWGCIGSEVSVGSPVLHSLSVAKEKISIAQCFATAVSWPSGESLVLQCNCARVPIRIWELFLCGFSVAIVG